MCNSGIYAIINRVNGKYYIGSAIKLHRRRYKHITELRSRCHDNKHLEKAWHKYGEDNFKFVTLELVEDISKLLEREQFWIDASNCCDENIGYNLCKIAGNQLGIKRSDSWKANMSRVHKGKITSIETKQKLRDFNRQFDKWPCSDGWKCKCDKCRKQTNNMKKVSRGSRAA